LAEAIETKPENIEFLRARLRELKTVARDDLAELRRDRDQMRKYKSLRDEHNKEVRGLIESVKAEREERDRINKEISEAKGRRSAIHAQLKEVYDEVRELRSKIVGSPSTDQRRMMRRVEELEWRQQTEKVSLEEERSIVEEIAKIEAKLVKIGKEKEKQDRISELRRMARRLKEEASTVHKKVLEYSEQSQIHHQEVVRIRPQLEEYKKSADTAHQNFVEWLKKVKAGEAKLKTIRTEIDDIYSKIRKFESEHRDTRRAEKKAIQREAERERVDEAVDKMKSGKRLTFDEFILAQREVTEEKRRDKKKRDKRATKEKPVKEEVPEVEENAEEEIPIEDESLEELEALDRELEAAEITPEEVASEEKAEDEE
jgi:uncharacterized coiled-coil DUF342 family protein